MKNEGTWLNSLDGGKGEARAWCLCELEESHSPVLCVTTMRATVFLRKLPLNTLKHANPRGKSAGHKIHDRQFWAIRQAGLTPTDSAPLDPTAFPTSYEPCPSIKLSYLYLPPSEHSQVFDELLKIGWRIEQEGKEISLRRELDLRSCRIEVDNSLVEGPKRRELVKEWIEWIGQVHKVRPPSVLVLLCALLRNVFVLAARPTPALHSSRPSLSHFVDAYPPVRQSVTRTSRQPRRKTTGWAHHKGSRARSLGRVVLSGPPKIVGSVGFMKL